MGFFDFLKRTKTAESDSSSPAAKITLPTPETMFQLNTMATQWIEEGSFAAHGFASQQDLMAAFTIVEMLGAASDMSDKDIMESLTQMFDITPDRCTFLLQQARRSIPKP